MCSCWRCFTLGTSAWWSQSSRLEMLETIGNKKNIPKFIKRAKDKNDPFRLMGFGHRVYKNYDPRAKILKQTCKKVLKHIGVKKDPVLNCYGIRKNCIKR
jgi:citrate synthase